MNKIVTLLGYIKQFSTNFINKFKRTITTSLLLINALKLDKHDLQYPIRALYFSVGKIDNLHWYLFIASAEDRGDETVLPAQSLDIFWEAMHTVSTV